MKPTEEAPAYTLRLATAADGPRLAEIYNRYVTSTTVSFETEPVSADEMSRRVREYEPFLVAEDGDGLVAGYAYAHPWKERAAYRETLETSVYLSAEATGHGLGRRLMEELISEFRRRGAHVLIACITAENTASCRFHEALGFRQVSLFKEVGLKFGRRLDVVDYELIL